uniref:transposase n=1 Tax=Variovorax beijingensis TaxID=2496117 RepID=UPI001CB8F582|nr:transposase [Variovorax beijingensis]
MISHQDNQDLWIVCLEDFPATYRPCIATSVAANSSCASERASRNLVPGSAFCAERFHRCVCAINRHMPRARPAKPSGLFGIRQIASSPTTAANEADVEQVSDLLHGKEDAMWADSGYRGAQGRVKRDVRWHMASRPSHMAEGRARARAHKQEYQKASIRAQVEHPFRVIKRQFGLAEVRSKGLAKNTAHAIALFALSNLGMVRRKPIAMMGQVRPQAA